jgi:hypothetical protein
MPEENPTRRPPSTFLLTHGSVGFQSMRSEIDDRWIEVVIEDDEVEITLVAAPAQMLAIGLNIAGMVANDDTGHADRIEARLANIERMVAALTERVEK